MMHQFKSLQNISEKKLVPGFMAKMVHTDQLTIAYVQIKEGSRLPEHAHVNEQITNIIEGELEMTVGGETKVCKAGDVVIIPSNVPHSAVALTDCFAIDVFQPAREDYRNL